MHAATASANSTQFTNIGVQVDNGTATYYLCFSSPVGPDVGGMVIAGPKGQHTARRSPTLTAHAAMGGPCTR